MTDVRVYYDPITKRVLAIEHRFDEKTLGATAYTDANRLAPHEADPWFVTDVNNRFDPEGDKIPVEFSDVDDTNPADLRINTNPGWAAEKADRRDRRRGAGGRRDVLLQKLADDTITDAEQRELMRLERGL